MSSRIVDRNWGEELKAAAAADRSQLRIICPFIKLGALNDLLRSRPQEIEVITRFNLRDFAGGVSDIAALERLLGRKARVRGIRHLHTKLYLFGDSRAAITSANLTAAALGRNQELGIITDDPETLGQCHAYFDRLWKAGASDLQIDKLESWLETVRTHQMKHGGGSRSDGLGDHGADAGLPAQPAAPEPSAHQNAEQAFVKFLGRTDRREPASMKVIDEIRESGCHWAMTYPKRKRPRSVQDGDVVYAGRMTRDPDDILVFGRGIAMAHVDDQDDATSAEIRNRPFKSEYPHYVRVHNVEFIDGQLAHGVSLNAMMAELSADAFQTTQHNTKAGRGNTEPRKAYRQQAAVRLSAEARLWLDERLDAAFARHGRIPEDVLAKID